MIEHYDFGTFTIDGKEYTTDIKIINKQVRPWTKRHGHNLTLEDIKDLLEIEPQTLIVGTGYSGLLQVSEEVVSLTKSKNILLIIKPTKQAAAYYNNLVQKQKKVVAIMHATC
jgi:hypothetical protein